MGALILLVMATAWFGLGVVLWRWLWVRRARRVPQAKHWMVALGAVWMLAPWVDEVWGSWVFQRECDALPAPILNIPVAVGVGEFFDEKGNRKLWTSDEIRRGASPYPRNDPQTSYAQNLKFIAAFDREFPKSTNSRRIRTFPVPIIEETSMRTHARSGMLVWRWRLLASPGGWIKRTSGWGSHAPYTCFKSSGSAPLENWLKFE